MHDQIPPPTLADRARAARAYVEDYVRKNRALCERVARTAVVVVIALILGWLLWWHYLRSPWTRDGRVEAEVVNIAAEISGKVTNLMVIDNQFVHKGDPLFIVDPDDYRLALAQAEAQVNSTKLNMEIQGQDAARRKSLGQQAVSIEEIQTFENNAAVAKAAYEQAVAARDVAKINMDRTTIYSPVNGFVTNLHLRIGDYATPGVTKLSILDTDSFWIAGYFEETKLPHIHEGDFARVKLMGVGPEVEGHVESLASGIVDTNDGGLGQGLANVDPIFTWVRLAQRIPVRIDIDHVPKGVRIVAGQTCTIIIEPPRK
jgi:multidrug resistance efflux pump